MKGSRLILALTAVPSVATLPFGFQWFLWSVGPVVFYWPLLPMSIVVLALSLAAFFSGRRWIPIALLASLPLQVLSLLAATLAGYPANGAPLSFSALEQAIIVGSEYLYLLGVVLLIREQPWRTKVTIVTEEPEARSDESHRR